MEDALALIWCDLKILCKERSDFCILAGVGQIETGAGMPFFIHPLDEYDGHAVTKYLMDSII